MIHLLLVSANALCFFTGWWKAFAWNEDVNDSSSFAAAGAEAFGATFKGLARIDRLPLPFGATTPADGLGSAVSSSRDCSPSAKSGLDRCATSDAGTTEIR